MKPACMDEREYALWREANALNARVQVPSPCHDCPLSFALEMRAVGRCDGEPVTNGRPLVPNAVPTDRHRSWRERNRARYNAYHRDYRARRKAAA